MTGPSQGIMGHRAPEPAGHGPPSPGCVPAAWLGGDAQMQVPVRVSMAQVAQVWGSSDLSLSYKRLNRMS